MPSYDVTASTSAPPPVVWQLLIDAATWPQWTPIDSLDRERSAGLDPDGHDRPGAVRAFRTGRTVTGERITELVDCRLLAYEDAFNAVMHDYHARVELVPDPAGGTRIRWRGTYGTQWWLRPFLSWYLRRFMTSMVQGLAAHAARQQAD